MQSNTCSSNPLKYFGKSKAPFPLPDITELKGILIWHIYLLVNHIVISQYSLLSSPYIYYSLICHSYIASISFTAYADYSSHSLTTHYKPHIATLTVEEYNSCSRLKIALNRENTKRACNLVIWWYKGDSSRNFS